MTVHSIEPVRANLHGHFSRELPPILTIESADRVRCSTVDAGWSEPYRENPFVRGPKLPGRDMEIDSGHALCGPIEIRGAHAGDVLEVRIHRVKTANWGWSGAGKWSTAWNNRIRVESGIEYRTDWGLDSELLVATSSAGHRVKMRPFLGVMGMPPDLPGRHHTFPPRFCGGNIDCRELVPGSTLYLPIAVEGALFSLGDGHAAQGDGEVAGPAIECPMSDVEVELIVRNDMKLSMPRAKTPIGWIAFGFNEDLNEAMYEALAGILDVMEEQLGYERVEAVAMASVLVDLHVTQIVNGVRGVHAILAEDRLLS
jgi:acetamidase/formamidase